MFKEGANKRVRNISSMSRRGLFYGLDTALRSSGGVFCRLGAVFGRTG